MEFQKKSLGQHWLTDEPTLAYIASQADLSPNDTVLEIGPGLGSLTTHLAKAAGNVLAIELDDNLAAMLPERVTAKNLDVLQGDILKYDLTQLPARYKVVANIPYYLTSNLIRILSESRNPPDMMVLLIQKEVAQRIGASPGAMSLLAVSVQLYYEVSLGEVIPAKLFSPPPKVDSQVLILNRRPKPLFKNLDTEDFFRVVKAGFSEKRKKLRSSLAGGLRISKEQADNLLARADISGDLRAESLNLQQWHRLYIEQQVKKDLRSLLS